MEEEGANDVVHCPKYTLSFAILLRGVGTGHTENDAMGEKECTGGRIVEFTTIVTLHTFDGGAKLRGNKREKMRKGGEGVGFQTKGERPQVVRAIIKDSEVIFKTRHTRNRGGPEVTVYEVEVAGSARMRGRKREAHMTTQLTGMT